MHFTSSYYYYFSMCQTVFANIKYSYHWTIKTVMNINLNFKTRWILDKLQITIAKSPLQHVVKWLSKHKQPMDIKRAHFTLHITSNIHLNRQTEY